MMVFAENSHLHSKIIDSFSNTRDFLLNRVNFPQNLFTCATPNFSNFLSELCILDAKLTELFFCF